MCGIVGYVGKKDAVPFLLDGLQALEYRGYDSAGVYVAGGGAIKRAGKVATLRDAVPKSFSGTAGIAHTRWATHGAPTEDNAHPHAGAHETVWLVHNGIIENYAELRDELCETGVVFRSETDSEVLAQLIESLYRPRTLLEDAVRQALARVRGTYGIAVMSTRELQKVVAARMGSPLLIGIGSDGHYLASDATPLVPHTRTVVYLDDGDIAVLEAERFAVHTRDNTPAVRTPTDLEWSAEAAQKQGHAHFMLKEMLEAPTVIENTLRGRLDHENSTAMLGGLRDVAGKLSRASRILITGCGSAYYAGLIGRQLIESLAGIPVDVEVASELRYRRLTADPENTILIAVSQSGETADTLEAIRIAKAHGMLTLGIVNVVGSTIARETDAGVYNHAGSEIGVASTKAFLSQALVFALIALFLARKRGMTEVDGAAFVAELETLQEKAARVLSRHDTVQDAAKLLANAQNALFIGRGFECPVAYEGALKLKEISYIHAEGYGAGEMKHGPIALIEPNFPTIAIAPKDSLYEKMCSNIEEIRARGGPVIAVTTDGNESDMARLAGAALSVPLTHEALQPILTTIPLQLLAYYTALARNLHIDQPRNLAKSVTVE